MQPILRENSDFNIHMEVIRSELAALAEPEYAKFAASLLKKPGENELTGSAKTVIGVRLPAMHRLAKKLAKKNWQENLSAFENTAQLLSDEYADGVSAAAGLSFEERMLWGFLIGEVTARFAVKGQTKEIEIQSFFEMIRRFLPWIDNWSLCDSFCAGLKFTRSCPKQMWEFLQPLFHSEEEYVVRFAVVMCINYFITEEYVDKLFPIFDEIAHEDYYVKMAAAWAVSICHVKFPEVTMPYLLNNRLDDFTYNKALQKILESRCVAAEMKERIRKMKRMKVKNENN